MGSREVKQAAQGHDDDDPVYNALILDH